MSKSKAGMFIVGTTDTRGKPVPYVMSRRVCPFGNTLRDPDCGACLAVKSEAGQWIDPLMKKFGREAALMIEERDEEGKVTSRQPEGIADKHWTASPEEV